jgi:diacylglycerol kinase family enzyme
MSRRPGTKITVFVNKDAGTIRNLPSTDFESVFREGLKTRDVEAEIYLVKGYEIAARIQAQISLAGGAAGAPQTIVVGGGDSTLGCSASVLAGTDIVLGILPLGTLNHLAKDLGLPLDIDGALDVIAAGDERLIDLAEVNGRIFVNNSSIGVYPFLVEERTAEQKRRRVGKLAAIFPALLTTLRSTSWHQVTITTEGRERSMTTIPKHLKGSSLFRREVIRLSRIRNGRMLRRLRTYRC